MLEIWRHISREKNYHKIQSMCGSYFPRCFHSSRCRPDIPDARMVLEHFSFMVMAWVSSTDVARSLISCTNVFFKDSDRIWYFFLHLALVFGQYTYMVSSISPFLHSASKVTCLSFHMYSWRPYFSTCHDQHTTVTRGTGREPISKLSFSHQ